ncbi:M20/M25/M40 family metallo-hydrolase [Chordicoccus furentiruminis]|uniref:M20/M25/M40 family metallo-hydrolase n=1 Tax=Chordicoccus furentiruminis TaxID=2709410 RepID=UPI0023A8AB0E|nr:M20/M25/M40 family metallo-hydrolase [Chordicoccus furentiruminis]
MGEVYAFHNLSGYPEGTVVYRPRLTQPASEGLTIAFEGRTCHASEPEKGRNPSQAIAEMVLFLGEKLREPHQGMLLGTVVGIQSGGNDFGLSAGEGAFRVTLRAEEETEMTALETALRERAEMLGKRDGLRVHVRTEDPFSATVNDDRCLEKVKAAAAALGIPSMKMNTLWRASEDFGYYQKRCPGAIFYIGNGESYPPLHTAEHDFDDRILPHAVDLFYEIARM